MGRSSSNRSPNGFAVLDKEPGWTSHDVVAKARGLLNTKKIGHSGTLDPSATGVIVLGVGRGTRLLRYISELPKTYEATFQLGIETSTLDADGEITDTHEMGYVSLAKVRRAATRFVGEIQQIPPMFSAIKIEGRRLHELARQGKEVKREPRWVTIHQLAITEGDRASEFKMSVHCSAGTYIRTLAADIGAALGGGAHIRNLRRTAIGRFTESMATPLTEISLISLAAGLIDRPQIVVVGTDLLAVRHGKMLDLTSLGATGPGPWVVVDSEGELLAVYELHNSRIAKPAVVVAPASN